MSEWRASTLGGEVELAYGKALPAHTRSEGSVKVYGSNGVVGANADALLEGPGIIVGRKGTVGAVVYAGLPYWPIDTTYYVVNKNDNDWRFLYYLLLASRLTELNSHSTVPGLNREDVYRLPVSIPGEAEQRRIAAVLDLVRGAADGQAVALAESETLKRAVMQELFTHGVRGGEPQDSEIGPIPEGWVAGRLGDSQLVSSGGTPARGVDEYWAGGTIPWVKTAEVNYSLITETAEHITQAGLDNSAAKLLPAGTVLIAMYGQGVTRGKVGILGIEATTNQACAAIQPKGEAVVPRFLYHLLAGRYEELRSLAHGGQQQNLNLDIIRDFPISYPVDLKEQQEIVEILDTLGAKIELHRQKKALYEELFQALLHGLMAQEIDVNDLDMSALAECEAVLA